MLLVSKSRPRASRQLFFALVIAALLLAGCSSAKRQFAQAEKLSAAGNDAAALPSYFAALEHVPSGDHKLVSLIELRIGESLWRMGKAKDAYAILQKSVAEDDDNIPAHLRMAEVVLAGDSPQEAMDQALMVLNRDPKNAEALSILGASFANSGRTAEARAAFEKAFAADATRVSVAITLADIDLQQNDPEAARSVLQRAASQNPSEPSPLLALARLDEVTGDPEAAERHYVAAIAAQDNLQTNTRLAQFLARTGRFQQAEVVLHRVDSRTGAVPTAQPDFEFSAGRTPQALKSYADLLQSRKGAPDLAEISARAIEADLQQASQDASLPQAISPNLERAKARLKLYREVLDPATSTLLSAEISMAEGNMEAASKLARSAIKLAPEAPSPHYLLGLIRERQGDSSLAIQEFKQSLRSDPDYSPARQALAALLFHHEDFNAAESLVSTVVVQEPGNWQALCLYGRVLLAKHDLPEARIVAHRALAANPGSAETRVLLGDVALESGHASGALIEYEQAVLLQPYSREAVAGLVRAFRTGKINRSMLRNMERIAQRAPISPALLEIAGRLYADQHWYSAAERCLRRAVQIDPGRASASAALVRTYLENGRLAQAESQLAGLGELPAALSAGVRAANAHNSGAAVEAYESALLHGDTTGVAANNLAWILAQNSVDLDRALALASYAHQLSPDDASILDTLGLVRIKRREYSEAVTTLRKAVELAQLRRKAQPDSPATTSAIREHLAQAYLLNGQPDAAKGLN